MKNLSMYIPLIAIILMVLSLLLQIIGIPLFQMPLYVAITIVLLDRLNLLKIIKKLNK